MTQAKIDRERIRIRSLADEYSNRGFNVVYPQRAQDLPPFLRHENYLPDLIATSENEKLIIEVKTSETIRADRDLARISDLVNQQAGWQFVFVLTNTKRGETSSPVSNHSRWREHLRNSRHPALAAPELADASFLLGWAALEGALREAAIRADKKAVVNKSPMSLVRDAAILGVVDRRSLNRIEELFRIRSAIAHSTSGSGASIQDVADLRRLIDDVIANLPDSSGTE